MNPRYVAVLVTVMVLTVGVSGAFAGVVTTPATDDTPDSYGTASTGDTAAEPGEQMTGAMAIQTAEVDVEVEERIVFHQAAEQDREMDIAEVLVTHMFNSDDRVSLYSDEIDELEAAYENGDISEGAAEAQLATLHVHYVHGERGLEQTHYLASDMHPDALETAGINMGILTELYTDAAGVDTGNGQAAAYAIAGESAGEPIPGDNKHTFYPVPDDYDATDEDASR